VFQSSCGGSRAAPMIDSASIFLAILLHFPGVRLVLRSEPGEIHRSGYVGLFERTHASGIRAAITLIAVE
jgi:hypothetical protein